jgi:hypothetical protein
MIYWTNINDHGEVKKGETPYYSLVLRDDNLTACVGVIW